MGRGFLSIKKKSALNTYLETWFDEGNENEYVKDIHERIVAGDDITTEEGETVIGILGYDPLEGV